MNWKIIGSNIREAREELEEIEKRIEKKDYPGEKELLMMFEHAYHHLNSAWNVRRVKTKQYANLTDAKFNKWSRFPKEIKVYRLSKEKSKK